MIKISLLFSMIILMQGCKVVENGGEMVDALEHCKSVFMEDCSFTAFPNSAFHQLTELANELASNLESE